MTSITFTAEPPTLRSIPSYGASSFYDGGAASLRRSYSCYNCNYSFLITRTTDTTSISPSSFRCPHCHHRHLISDHTVSPPPPAPPPPPVYSPVITIDDYQTSDSSDSDDDLDSLTPTLHLYRPALPLHSPTLKSFVDSLPDKQFPPNSTPSLQACSICMDDFVVNSINSGTVSELPCKHYFHRDCIVEWLRRSNTCPLCRHKLPNDRGREELTTFRELSWAATAPRGDLSESRGELSGVDLDPMRDEDGDTLMMDA